jgi:predicted O-methyltransferase YrrM
MPESTLGAGETAALGLLDIVPNFASIGGWVDLPQGEALFEAAASAASGCIVEVGSYRGRCTLALCAGSSVGAKRPVYAIDPHEEAAGTLGGRFGFKDRAAFFNNFAPTPLVQHVRLLNATSTVVAKGWEKPVSLLVIDGDHRYAAVHADFAAWEPHLVAGATVAFDNCNLPGPKRESEALVAAGTLNFVRRIGDLGIFNYVGGRLPAVGRLSKAARQRLGEYTPRWQDIGYHIYYGGNGTYLYQPIPKCACTTIKTLLLELEELPVDGNEWRRHQKEFNGFPGTNRLSEAEQRDVFEGRTDTFKFVIVRNPYSRLSSVYRDKIVLRPDRHCIDQILASARAMGIALSDPITFNEFVEVIAGQNYADMDPHWRPQYFEGRFATVKYDFVGRTEMMPDDLIYALERIAAPQSIIARATERLNVTGADLAPWKSVAAAVRDRFLDTFAIDFEILQYPRALTGGLPPMTARAA